MGLVVLGSEVGGRWNGETGRFVLHLLLACYGSGRKKHRPLSAARPPQAGRGMQ